MVRRFGRDGRRLDGYDVVIVGSGINALVCAALLARRGRRVALIERNDRLGGCIRTEQLFPGFTHDVLSSWYPLFLGGPAFAELAGDLEARGLTFANTETPTGVLTPDGSSLVLTTDSAANRERIDALAAGDGARFVGALDEFFAANARLTFGLLGGEPRSGAVLGLLAKELRARRLGGAIEFAGAALESCRTWLERDFRSDVLRALVAPWVLHAGLGPDDAYSGLMGKVIIGAVAAGGLPVAVGGSQRVVDAFARLIADHGGRTITGAEVESVLVDGGRASGVRTTDGRMFAAAQAVVCNVTPQQLYQRLLAPEHVPAPVAGRAAAYRYGRADMQIHYALSEPPAWADPELARTAMVHLTPGLDGVSRAVNEAERGLLPAVATIVVGQPTAVDPSRAPDGAAILWIQLQELPRVVRGDAAGELEPGAGGAWTAQLAEAYADRIEARLSAHLPNLATAMVGRRVLSPADLEAINPNLVGGDPYSGACTLDQFLLWRPLGVTKNHETPVKGLYHIGASTHPGPGLGGGSGYLVAQHLS
jgi:phytoene dehydrogenase-like protein